MEKVSLYIFDSRNKSFSDLLSFANLSNKELEQFQEFRIEKVKKEKLISYYLKKTYVGDFYIGEHGKPMSDNMYFNISHSKEVIVLVTSKNIPVGVDVEVIKERREPLVRYVANEKEYDFIQSDLDFIKIWTSKESLMKCLGTGLDMNMKIIPSFPFEGCKSFEEQYYYSKMLEVEDFVICITLKGKDNFEIEVNKL